MSVNQVRDTGRRMAATAYARVVVEATSRRERGDMPGWVMITVMTAVIVVGLLAVAQTQLENIFETAINSVRDQIN